jgi:glutaredoxin
MISIIGTPACSRCTITKNILDSRKIPYEYRMFTELSSADQDLYMRLAEKSNHLSFPLIIKDNAVVTLQEI